MSQRIFGVVLLLACAGLGITAWGYHAPFSYEPVGPRAYPLLLLILMALGAVYLLVKPASASSSHSDEPPLDKHVISKVVGCVVLLTIYAALFEVLGFIPASVVFGIAMARLYEGTWFASLVSGVVMGIGLYVLFDRFLDVPLPLGILSSLEF